MKKNKKLKGIGKLKLKELKIEKQEKAREEKKEKSEKPVKEEAKETKLETETLEAITESRAVPASHENTFHEENAFREVEFFEPEISTKEFVAPVLTPAEETKEPLEVTAQNAPTPKTNISVSDNEYTSQKNISYSSYSPDSSYEASTRGYETREDRRKEERARFDIKEGLIVDSSKIVPTLTHPLANPFISGRDRTTPQMAELEEFAEEQKKYKEKIQEETLRRKRMR